MNEKVKPAKLINLVHVENVLSASYWSKIRECFILVQYCPLSDGRVAIINHGTLEDFGLVGVAVFPATDECVVIKGPGFVIDKLEVNGTKYDVANKRHIYTYNSGRRVSASDPKPKPKPKPKY